MNFVSPIVIAIFQIFLIVAFLIMSLTLLIILFLVSVKMLYKVAVWFNATVKWDGKDSKQ